jgi:multidrug resistance protein, MATE family
MTAVITCYAPFIGFATALDTLCSQAYGAGHRHLVGLQFQRMCYFLLLCYVPIAFTWWHGEAILSRIVPEPRSAELAGQYLRVLVVSVPFSAIHEAGERFVRAQGLFNAGTYVLLAAVPVNVFANWLLVWKLDWGFIGGPVAAAFTQILLPFFLFLYVRFVDGYQCWGGFSKRAFVNWGTLSAQYYRLPPPQLLLGENAFFMKLIATVQ